MTKNSLRSIAGPALIMLAFAACNFSVSTARISSFKVAKDEQVTTAATEFAPKDTIYAKAEFANVPGKITATIQTIAEKAAGQTENFHIEALDKSYDLPGDGNVSYNLSPPNAGWPAGKYRLEVKMMVDGVQKDQKTAAFTVTGG